VDLGLDFTGITALLMAIVSLVLIIYHIGYRWGKYVERVDTNSREIGEVKKELASVREHNEAQWQILLTNGTLEGLRKGIFRHRSLMRVAEDILQTFPELAQEIKDWYKREGLGLETADLAAKIEKTFGEKLVPFCLKYDVPPSTGVVAAIYVCTGKMPVNALA
jgi:hypothetical protein